MFHILTLTYQKPLDVVDQTRPAHVAWLNDEVAAGRILLAGRQESQAGGVLVTGDISVEEAQSVIDRDPYSLAGLVSYERLSFNGSIRAPGL
ncbi:MULTISPECIES: YciI family protein [unclassified Mycolicibacterium]|uniref:YciI family protein n=1 Tax=unclassified Mycolicibacterium TaxID=2636767 RepID=UPI0012DE9E80|nr:MULTISPECIES: YciI family protein [unclassified Mycolicibacterium]MUL80660.1 GTP cyclohydrolase [Mycolicibacterium sp. CBMA 329]MUL86427.1 GTP cyclohydrolase [Mycolicibacterium sp. CBMA 331]MUM01289.1 GTP cyclohydrolase [Mycolicibacterium sp. CBMA 334]MUM29024.1 GTP cyclohydrolase [Mycolicibacterium sp. CBMA 295]MUM36723.1 GTP cyclohydrolase [Mycolicibacterium sp. CBMA 247]